MTPALTGIAAGGVAALGAARLMEKLVFGVSAADPLTLAAVSSTLALVALLASLIPRTERRDWIHPRSCVLCSAGLQACPRRNVVAQPV